MSRYMVLSYIIKLILLYPCTVQGAELDSAIERAAHKYGVETRVLQAIAHLESSGGRNVKLRKNSNGTYDLGPFQINSVHWTTTCKAYDVSTTQGNAYCAAKLLHLAKRASKRDPHWVGRYHSKTPSLKLKYAKKIKVFMAAGR